MLFMATSEHITTVTDTISTLSIQETVFLLILASFVALLVKRVKIPYTLALVIVGLLVGTLDVFHTLTLTPNLILFIFLPPLLFEAAWNINIKHLKENILPITLFAIIGLLLSTATIGVLLNVAMNVKLAIALLFGAMISATDPVSVLAIFKKLGLPKRLATIVEGESLFNDGTAVVIFKIILGVALAGSMALGSPSQIMLFGLFEFIIVMFGGALVGIAVGWLFSSITAQVDDPMLEITLTTIVAYGAFLLAESIAVPFAPESMHLHLSGVIATVSAGLVLSNYGRPIGMSATTRVAVDSFWEYAAFLVNSFVFLLVGLNISFGMLYDHIGEIIWAILAIVLARLIVIYLLTFILNIKTRHKIPFSWQHVMFWGGLRGSLSMALVLSIPLVLPERESLMAMVFGVVLFTLIVQGLSITKLIDWLGLAQENRTMFQYALLKGRILSVDQAITELESVYKRGEIAKKVFEKHESTLSEQKQQLVKDFDALQLENEEIEREQHAFIERHLKDVKHDKLSYLLRQGIITEDVYAKLEEELES